MWYNIDVTEPHPVATPEARACPAKNSALPRRIIFVEAACMGGFWLSLPFAQWQILLA